MTYRTPRENLPERRSPQGRSSGSSVRFLGILASGVFVLAIASFWMRIRTPEGKALSAFSATPAKPPIAETSQPEGQPGPTIVNPDAHGAKLPVRTAPAANEAGRSTILTANGTREPPTRVRQLVSLLGAVGGTNGLLSSEAVRQWKDVREELVAAGSTSVPAIREFLSKNIDTVLSSDGGNVFGYATTRIALFATLAQIGGPEAITATLQTLQETADPREVALLAQSLDQMEPGQHRQEVLAAARESLAMAVGGKLLDRDVAPLFEVFQKYGDASVVPDLEKAATQWNYYAMIALAQLPEGAGISSLIRTIQGQEGTGSSTRMAALAMLASTAPLSEEARGVLLDQARQNKLTPLNWAALGPVLAGDQVGFLNSAFEGTGGAADKNDLKTTHIAFGNQTFYSAQVGNLTPDRINQQVNLIDELQSATTDPAAVQILQQAKSSLTNRLSRSATSP